MMQVPTTSRCPEAEMMLLDQILISKTKLAQLEMELADLRESMPAIPTEMMTAMWKACSPPSSEGQHARRKGETT